MIRNLFFLVLIFTALGFTSIEEVAPMNEVYLENKIVISPNPAVSITKVFSKNSAKKIVKVEVFSMVNEKVLEKKSGYPAQSLELRVHSLRNGKYFVKVFLSDGSEEIATLIKTK